MPEDAASIASADERFSIDLGKIFKTEDFCPTYCFHSAQNLESKDFIDKILKNSDLAAVASRRAFSANLQVAEYKTVSTQLLIAISAKSCQRRSYKQNILEKAVSGAKWFARSCALAREI